MSHNQKIKNLLERQSPYRTVFQVRRPFASPFLIAEKTDSDDPDLILTLIECDSEIEIMNPSKHRPKLYVYKLWDNALSVERWILGKQFRETVVYYDLEFNRDLPHE